MKSTFTRNVDSVNITSFLWFNYSKIIKSATKMGKNTSTILYCCFSKWTYTLSHQTTLCHKKTKFAFISSIYLVFLPLEMQKRLKQTQVYHTFFFFLLHLKRNDSQTLKRASCKSPFLQWVCYWYNLLRWKFFALCDNWRTLLSEAATGSVLEKKMFVEISQNSHENTCGVYGLQLY